MREVEEESEVARVDGLASWCGGICPKSWSAVDEERAAEVMSGAAAGHLAVAAASKGRGESWVVVDVAAESAAAAVAAAAAAAAAVAVAAAEKRTMAEVMTDVAGAVADAAAVDVGGQDHRSQRRMRNRRRVLACREGAQV